MPGKTVVVIGGGVAGASAALELAAAGVKVELIEKGDFLGGHAALLACKAVDSCQSCNGCLAEERLGAVMAHPGINIRRRSRVKAVAPRAGGYTVTLEATPPVIDPAQCTGCGLCLEVCPVEGAIQAPPLAYDRVRLAVNPAACLFYQDGTSTLCRDACPEEAIAFGGLPVEEELAADALVLAAGFAPYAPGQKTRLGYGRVADVITGMELEAGLRRAGKVLRPSDGEPPQRVAFVQCVGSRERGGNNYCSRVCCGYGLRLGRMLKGRLGAEVTMFYMDFQSFGPEFDEFLREARSELEMVRCLPYDLLPGPGGKGVKVAYQPMGGAEPVEREFDLMVLSVGITPGADHPELAAMTGLGLGPQGFLAEGAPGVFVAGAAARPMDVAESVAHAGRAAGRALAFMEGN